MKLAASDFDGTLYKEQGICAENVLAIKKWREAGHKFGVITGRDYGMLLPQLRHFGIEDDFSICNNGAIIFDGSGKLLYQAEIPADLLGEIASQECVAKSLHIAFSEADRTCLYRERERSWILREAIQWGFQVERIDLEQIFKLRAVQQISLGFDELEDAAICTQLLNRDFGRQIRAYQNRGSVDITPAFINKSQGIQTLLEKMSWGKGTEVYAIGDETNDLPMIRAFDGYAIASAREEIRQEAKKTFLNVGSMLREFI
jgi:Cof subfamily protein (haloacid dehalogenase superfamily)